MNIMIEHSRRLNVSFLVVRFRTVGRECRVNGPLHRHEEFTLT